jgi:citrate synthase
VTEDLRRRSKVPAHVKSVLDALPPHAHPMTQFTSAVMALQVGGWVGGWVGHQQEGGWQQPV